MSDDEQPSTDVSGIGRATKSLRDLSQSFTDPIGTLAEGGEAMKSMREMLDRQRALIEAVKIPTMPKIDIPRFPEIPGPGAYVGHPNIEGHSKPTLPDLRLPPNPIHETNEKLEHISQRFEAMLQIMANASEIATRIQSHADNFITQFDEASRKTDASAKKAIGVAFAAILITIFAAFVPIFIPDKVGPEIRALSEQISKNSIAEQELLTAWGRDNATSGVTHSENIIRQLRANRESNEALMLRLERALSLKTAD